MWIRLNEKTEYNDSKKNGLRLRFYNGVDIEVRQASKYFCKWLRTFYWFPIRCNVHFFNIPYVKAYDGSKCSALFSYLENDIKTTVKELPKILVATGYYAKQIKKREKKVVIFNIFDSIVHELTHYYQWYFMQFDEKSRIDRSFEREAKKWSNYVLSNYILNEYWAKLYGVDKNGYLL